MEYEVFTNDVLKVVNWFRVKNFSDMKLDDNVEPITQMKVMKLLYYVQGVSLAAYEKKMFPDDIVAWKYGPAISKVHSKYHGMRAIVDESADTLEECALKDYNELENHPDISTVVNSVYETYGDMSASDLLKQTHKELPWKKTEQSSPISIDLIKNYFKEEILSESTI